MAALNQNTLSPLDYVVFVGMLLVSSAIGVFYATTGGKQKTTEEYLMADSRMAVVPVAMSLMVSFVSAITLLGTASEAYQYGTQYWMIGPCYIIVVFVTGYVLLPVFFRLRITSVYEYLERRYNKIVRMQATITFILQMVSYMGVVLYAPTLALSAATGLQWHLAVLLIGAVAAFYTTIGGMKAVIWTDVFQCSLMFAGMLAVCIIGTVKVGGISSLFDTLSRGKRLNFWDFNPNPWERHTIWSLWFGGATAWLVMYGVNQSQVQRYFTTPSLQKARAALWINGPGLFGLMTVSCYAGLVAYAYYENCDPLTSGRIAKGDQILPLFVIDALNYPGFVGFFVASISSGALSTLSSGLNALAAVTLEDIIKPYFADVHGGKAAFISKLIAATFGLLALGMAFVAPHMGGVLSSFLGLHGMVGGPVLGIFLMGVLFRQANWKGACVGHLLGLALSLWVGIGGTVYKYPHTKAPLSTAGCTNVSEITSITSAPIAYEGLDIYRLSYLWRGTWAVICTMVIGMIVSLLTGGTNDTGVDGELLCSLEDTFGSCLSDEQLDSMRPKLPRGHPSAASTLPLRVAMTSEEDPSAVSLTAEDD